MLSNRSAEMSRRAFILATAVLAAGCIRSEPGGRVRLAAGDPGGLYLAFAEILAKRVQTRYPNIAVDVLPTEGTVENLARLRSADVDMGLALADVAERDRATGPAGTAPQAVARVYENYLQVIVRDSAAAQQLSDLQGMRVSIGPPGSGAAATSEVLFEAAGLRGRVDMLRYPPEGRTSSARGRQRGRTGVVGRRTDTGDRRPRRRTATADARHWPAGGTDEPPRRLPVRRPPSADRRVRATRHTFSSECPTCCCAAKTSPPTWSPRSWTYSPPTHRNWCLPTSGGCSTSTHPR